MCPLTFNDMDFWRLEGTPCASIWEVSVCDKTAFIFKWDGQYPLFNQVNIFQEWPGQDGSTKAEWLHQTHSFHGKLHLFLSVISPAFFNLFLHPLPCHLPSPPSPPSSTFSSPPLSILTSPYNQSSPFICHFSFFPPSGSQFAGFPGHVVGSQRKLAQHSAINNWGGPTWPGTLSLNGLFWEGSMPAYEDFIRACRWNVQGHRQCSPLSVLILPSSRVTLSTPPPFSSSQPPSCYPPTLADDRATPQEHSGLRLKVQFWIKHKWPSKTVYESFILYDDLECDAGE